MESRREKKEGRRMKASFVIDSNERGPLCDAVQRWATREGIPVRRDTLVVGDYQAGASVIEAKSIPDFFASSHSGHLWRQLDNMDANCDRVFMVIHGDIAKHVKQMNNMGKRITYSRVASELTGTFARIMADFDCSIYRAKDHNEAAQFIIKLHQKLHKPASRHGARAIRRVSSNDIRADMLLSIPGFGLDLVERTLEMCGSIEEMAFPEATKKVKGMGPTLRKRLTDVLTSEVPVKAETKVKK
tara:strand:+ start:872 stop:1603 length:732 start_codon:yes stop_codon:yes gene_type:complete